MADEASILVNISVKVSLEDVSAVQADKNPSADFAKAAHNDLVAKIKDLPYRVHFKKHDCATSVPSAPEVPNMTIAVHEYGSGAQVTLVASPNTTVSELKTKLAEKRGEPSVEPLLWYGSTCIGSHQGFKDSSLDLRSLGSYGMDSIARSRHFTYKLKPIPGRYT